MSKKSLLSVTVLSLFLLTLTACASTPAESPIAEGQPVPAATAADIQEPDTTTIIRHKGSEAGLNIIPAWVEAYLDGGTEAVEALPDFTATVCYVMEVTAPTLEEGFTRALSESLPEGARQVSGWWMLVHRADAAEDYYAVYVLYTAPKDTRTPQNI